MGQPDSVSRTQRKVYLMKPKNLARTNTLAYFVQPSVTKKRVLKSFALEVKAIRPFLFGTDAAVK
jgi:hypothetical protein